MGTALIKLRIMPSSPQTNLEEIKEKGKEKISELGGEVRYEEEPIAFGLKAIIAFVKIDESKGSDPVEESFNSIDNVNSVEIIDYRRAIE